MPPSTAFLNGGKKPTPTQIKVVGTGVVAGLGAASKAAPGIWSWVLFGAACVLAGALHIPQPGQ